MEINQAEADLRAVGGDPALAAALTDELSALLACKQVKQPAAGVQVPSLAHRWMRSLCRELEQANVNITYTTYILDWL